MLLDRRELSVIRYINTYENYEMFRSRRRLIAIEKSAITCYKTSTPYESLSFMGELTSVCEQTTAENNQVTYKVKVKVVLLSNKTVISHANYIFT